MEERIQIDYNSQTTAGFVDELFHPIHLMYRVKFDDGYENIFFTDVDNGKWIEQDIGFTGLAEKVGEQIKSLYPKTPRINRHLRWYYAEEKGDITPTNFAFYNYSLGAFPVFEIYAPNRRFLFSMILVNKDFWQVFRIEDDWECSRSEELMNRLPEILEEFITDTGHPDYTA